MFEANSCALSVVIPSFNESDRLPRSLSTLGRFLLESDDIGPAEIIVVDDGSTDQTAAVARDFLPPDGTSVRVLRHPHNRGKGAAVRSGFAHSVGRQVLLSDADLSAPISGLRLLLAEADESSVVIGSRAVDRSLLLTPQPRYRDLMGRTFNLLVRSLLLPGIFDTQCGFKLFPGEVARSLATVQKVDGFAYDVELLSVSLAWGLTVVEIGVPWGHVEASRVLAGRHSAQMFRDLLKITLRRWTGGFPDKPDIEGAHG